MFYRKRYMRQPDLCSECERKKGAHMRFWMAYWIIGNGLRPKEAAARLGLETKLGEYHWHQAQSQIKASTSMLMFDGGPG